jgi:TRAP-type C4-dicarboxylate transport system permease small subunit
MDGLWKTIERIAHGAVLAGCALLFLAAVMLTAEVLVRKALPDAIELTRFLAGLVGVDLTAGATRVKLWLREHLTFSGSDELSGYLFAVGTSWSMAYVLVTRGHVRIDVLYGNLGAKTRAALDILALVVLLVFVGALIERAWDVASTSLGEGIRSNTNLRIPLAWAQIPWMAGIGLFLVAIIVALLRSLLLALNGDAAGVNRIAGASSQDEEIESELKGLGLETPHAPKV